MASGAPNPCVVATATALVAFAVSSLSDSQIRSTLLSHTRTDAALQGKVAHPGVLGTGKGHRDFYVRQLRDMKGAAAIETMTPAFLARYGQLCGTRLAGAHARTGNAAKITGYLGDDDTFDRAIQRFAIAYADQTDLDYASFTRAADEQRIAVEAGV